MGGGTALNHGGGRETRLGLNGMLSTCLEREGVALRADARMPPKHVLMSQAGHGREVGVVVRGVGNSKRMWASR